MASYAEITSPKSGRRGLSQPRKSPVVAVLALCALLFSVFAVAASAFTVQKQVQQASAFDPINTVICNFFPEDGIVRNGYQASQTDAVYFDSQSKSAVNSGKEDVNSGLNWILMASGMDFDKVNEGIIGQEVEKAGTSFRPEAEMSEEELKEQWNKGPQVTPFDRFGMAGTSFTSYNGEWKYYLVDACSKDEPVDLKEGMYYDERLETKSTWEDRADSQDPRTVQHYKGETSRFWFGFVTLVSNLVFWVTKFITTTTIAFINFSFSNMSETLGLDTIVAGDKSNQGLFSRLFTSIYMPFIVLVFAVTGLKLIWDGIAKRQFRNAFNSAAIAVGMFILAIIVAAKPALFINLPNNAAVTVQAVIVKTFTGSLAGEDGICKTDMGSKPIGLQKGVNKKDDQKFLEGVAQNMRSAIGCTFWQTFVFKPWAEGQWGVDWNKTWAKGKTPSWAPKGAQELKNTNEEMVGVPTVPLGDGKTMENWAVFNMSTLTNAHSPIGHEGSFSKYSQGVAHDWWRIVDALTNYEEKQANTSVNSKETGSEKIEYTVPKGNPALEQWDTWSGNSPGNRFGAAVSSLFIGAVGLIAPFSFGLLAAAYSIGMTIVMVFLPIALLLGSWGGRGFEIFKQWAMLLWNLFTKRIAVGIMLMLSIVFVNAAIVLMKDIGWWQGAVMLAILSLILIKSRHRLVDMMAAGKGGGLTNIAGRISQGISNTGRAVGGVAVSTATGAAYAKMRGGSLRDGAKVGLGQELNNLSYRTPFLRDVRVAQQAMKASQGDTLHDEAGNIVEHCALCGEPFEDGSFIKMGADGLWYCQFCAESEIAIEGGVEMLYVSADREKARKEELADPRLRLPVAPLNSQQDQRRAGGKLKRLLSGVSSRQKVGGQQKPAVDPMSPDSAVKLAVWDTANTVDDVRSGKLSKESLLGANVPVELQPYLDSGMLETLVENQDWEAVSSAYVSAYILALEAITGSKFNELLEQLLAQVQTDYRTTSDARVRESQLSNPPEDRATTLSNPYARRSQDEV